jgi:type II secretory ATPase GspE/PulE/Tfp pilus assembly ATPase PilB-like protein
LPYIPDENEAQLLGWEAAGRPAVYQPAGCDHCDGKGYRGRMALIEVLRLDTNMDELIAAGAAMQAMRQAAHERGYHPLAEDGIRRILEGLTSLAEVSRVVDLTGRV